MPDNVNFSFRSHERERIRDSGRKEKERGKKKYGVWRGRGDPKGGPGPTRNFTQNQF